ncbi:MAG: anthrone oxygenase family protein, partial [Sneathiella sp.]
MQVINQKVYRSFFIVLLLGMAVASPFLIGYAYVQLTGTAAMLLMTGGGIYLGGVLVVSLLFNVPMNHKLETFDHSGSAAAAYWQKTYLTRWVFWNHIRALASGAAAVCFLAACVLLAQGAGIS